MSEKVVTNGVILVTQTRVKDGKDGEFAQWQTILSKAIAKFPGYTSSSITPANPPVQLDWVIMQHFDSAEHAKTWLQSPERQELLKKAKDLIAGFDDVYLLDEKKETQNAVVATITAKIEPQDTEKFLEWHARVAAIQSTFSGFIGARLEKPRPGINDSWITILTFDSDKHLEAWLKSSERKKLIDELQTFSSESHLRKAYFGFDFWFSKNEYRSVWKENMLVLLTLYPVVFLLSYITKPLIAKGLPSWLALFFGNALSTAILGWVTVPWLMKMFNWWLHPSGRFSKRLTIQGVLIVVLLYCVSLYICWQLFTHRAP